MPAGRPRIYNTPEELEIAIDDYFNPLVETYIETQTKSGTNRTSTGSERKPREKVTISGLAYHLGFDSRQSLYDYEEKEEFSYIVKRARLRVEMSYEERLAEQSCAGAIFALKNMGWKDKTEVESNNTHTIWNEEKTYEVKPQTD